MVTANSNNQIVEHLDDVLNKFDWRNAYFVFVFFATSSVWLFAAMSIMVSSFTASVGISCHNTTNCAPLNGTIAWEFNLNGDRARLTDISTSVYAIGSIVGALTLTRIADFKGRRPVVLISLFLSGLFGCFAALAPSIYMFMAARFIQGICFIGCAIDSWVLSYETVPKPLRDFATLTFGLMWVVGYLLVAPFAYWIHNWRILLFSCSIPCVCAASIFYFLLPESFRYMVLNGCRKELEGFFTRVNRFDGTGIEIDLDLLIYDYRVRREHYQKRKLIVELLDQKKFLLYTLVLSYLWLYNTFVYYGLSLFSTDLAGNQHLNYVYLGLVEIPANVFSPYFLSLLGRKFFVFGSHLTAAVAFVISIFIKHPVASLIIWLVSKSATVCAFNSLFVCASELFPTTIRSGCIGVCEIVARVGGAMSPIFHSFEGGSPVFIKCVYAFTGLAGALSTLVIPDTSKSNLPDTTSELNEQR